MTFRLSYPDLEESGRHGWDVTQEVDYKIAVLEVGLENTGAWGREIKHTTG